MEYPSLHLFSTHSSDLFLRKRMCQFRVPGVVISCVHSEVFAEDGLGEVKWQGGEEMRSVIPPPPVI